MGGRHQNFEDPMTWTQDIRKTKFHLVRFFFTHPLAQEDDANYEIRLANELVDMNVDGGTHELIQRKATCLNISN